MVISEMAYNVSSVTLNPPPLTQSVERYCSLILLLDCLLHIARRDGLLAWWNGLLPSLVLVSNPAINFMIYEALKRNILPTLALWVSKKILHV